MTKTIVLLPGDGVGPEVTKAAEVILTAVSNAFDLGLSLRSLAFGGAAIDETGDPLPPETLSACQSADAVFLGAVGGPKWDDQSVRPEAGLLRLRKALDVFANLRPTRIYKSLLNRSPLRTVTPQTDFVIVRELVGGIYFGERSEGTERASDVCLYEAHEVERIARVAFEAAQKRSRRLVSVDKANVLASSRLWRTVVTDLGAREFSDVALDHMLVDAMAMRLIQSPDEFDVIVTENMFGDILSDEASVISGSIGLSPSASLGATGQGLYEPIHGSAPDIAGQDIANPIGAVASAAMMLRYSFAAEAAAQAIETAIETVISSGQLTRDLGGALSCSAVTDRLLSALGDSALMSS
ncbi:MAG: 3-isopropylmalate dehydrogenase [Pseudomonadota bacterium]